MLLFFMKIWDYEMTFIQIIESIFSVDKIHSKIGYVQMSWKIIFFINYCNYSSFYAADTLSICSGEINKILIFYYFDHTIK